MTQGKLPASLALEAGLDFSKPIKMVLSFSAVHDTNQGNKAQGNLTKVSRIVPLREFP